MALPLANPEQERVQHAPQTSVQHRLLGGRHAGQAGQPMPGKRVNGMKVGKPRLLVHPVTERVRRLVRDGLAVRRPGRIHGHRAQMVQIQQRHAFHLPDLRLHIPGPVSYTHLRAHETHH